LYVVEDVDAHVLVQSLLCCVLHVGLHAGLHVVEFSSLFYFAAIIVLLGCLEANFRSSGQLSWLAYAFPAYSMESCEMTATAAGIYIDNH
jgi:hypothetical protein